MKCPENEFLTNANNLFKRRSTVTKGNNSSKKRSTVTNVKLDLVTLYMDACY